MCGTPQGDRKGLHPTLSSVLSGNSPGRPQGSPPHATPPPPLQRGRRGRPSSHFVLFVRAGAAWRGVETLAVALVLELAGAAWGGVETLAVALVLELAGRRGVGWRPLRSPSFLSWRGRRGVGWRPLRSPSSLSMCIIGSYEVVCPVSSTRANCVPSRKRRSGVFFQASRSLHYRAGHGNGRCCQKSAGCGHAGIRA
jgi:hypothetical protein